MHYGVLKAKLEAFVGFFRACLSTGTETLSRFRVIGKRTRDVSQRPERLLNHKHLCSEWGVDRRKARL